MSEFELDQLESQFPPLSGVAFSHARDEVLRSGQSILVAEDGVIYRVTPDGQREPIKKIDPPVEVEQGIKIRMK